MPQFTFHADDKRRLTWMTRERVLCSDWKPFMNSLGYEDRGLDEAIGLRPHTEGVAAIHKSKLIRYSTIVKAARVIALSSFPF